MGTSVDAAQQRVKQQRSLIERKVQGLESRVGQDVWMARQRVTHHVTHLPDLMPGGSQVMDRTREHPYTALAGALGIGVALGMASGGHDDGRDAGGPSLAQQFATWGASAGTAGGALSASLLSPLRPYIASIAQNLVADFLEPTAERRESGTPAPRPAAHSGNGSTRH